MFSLGSKVLLLFLLAFPCGFMSIDSVSADPESAEDAEPDDALNEEDDDEEMAVEEDQVQSTEGDDDDSEPNDGPLPSHSDVDTTIIFITGEEFPADKVVNFLVGFTNKGSQDFTVQSLETSLRYPQDFQFYIQNLLKSVSDTPQYYTDYVHAPLLMFMYVFLVGLVILVVFGMYHVLESRTKKRISLKVEKGTVGINDVDISWIPQETLNVMNKASPKTSPRKRNKRAAGVDQ
ncbi:translocon-associated protein subunit alpha-like [Thalassophryne amazonica]|uniref:translocon-associated protein subunit alpha-like n=1 Tax=Thalassophryne amazonica TaxID=390379 RepID=UPI0014724488|nr:translocon-associated protein subunit alpha-like [Thalassophryne amazonica]